jgi:WD40 repeat protein
LYTSKTDGKTFWTGLALHPDNSRFAVLGRDRTTAALWDFSDGPRASLGRGVTGVVFSPDGNLMAVARAGAKDVDPEVTLYDRLSDLHVRHHLRPTDKESPALVAFTPDGKRLITVGHNEKATLVTRWDVATGQALVTHTIPQAPETRINYALSADGNDLAILMEGDSLIRVIDTETGKARVPNAGHTRPVGAVAWSPDGKDLITADVQGRLIKWDVARRKPAAVLDRSDNQIRQIAFSADGLCFITNEYARRAGQSTVVVWNAHDLTPLGPLALRKGQNVGTIAISPDGATVAIANADQTVSLGPRSTWERQYILPHNEDLSTLAFSLDGEDLWTGGAGGNVRLWKVISGQELGRWGFVDKNIRRLQLLPNGNDIGVLSVARNREAEWPEYEVWDWKANKLCPAAKGPVFSKGSVILDASPTIRLVAMANPTRKLVLWQPAADKELCRYFDYYPTPTVTAFSPDGRYLAVGDAAGVVSILRLAERGQVPELPVWFEPELIPPPHVAP